jgi:hypothetical protein
LGSASPTVDDGGQAGMFCSVGGSGGQMSVSSGTAPCAGATSSCSAPCSRTGTAPCARPPAGGHVRFANGFSGGCEAGASSVEGRTCESGTDASPGGSGTVWAHVGAGFCIGTACFGSVFSSTGGGGSVLAQSGPDSFCIGSAGRGSASAAGSVVDCAPLSFKGGATGTVRAHTGVVSCVGTAGAGSSGGLDSCGLADSDSKAMVSLSLRYGVVCEVQANTLVSASSAIGSGCCSAQSAASEASLSESA